jgi:hypothetical protein
MLGEILHGDNVTKRLIREKRSEVSNMKYKCRNAEYWTVYRIMNIIGKVFFSPGREHEQSLQWHHHPVELNL